MINEEELMEIRNELEEIKEMLYELDEKTDILFEIKEILKEVLKRR